MKSERMFAFNDNEDRKFVSYLHDLFFSLGFNSILDEGVWITFPRYSKYNRLYIGPHPDDLFRQSMSAVLESGDRIDIMYYFDMQTMNYSTMMEKLGDIFFDLGLHNIMEKSILIRYINRWPGGSKNNILYIGPDKE